MQINKKLCSSEHRFHETSLITDDAPRFIGIGKCLLTVCIEGHLFSIRFIGGQAWKTEKRQCNIIRPLMGEKISMMGAAKFIDQGNPHGGVLFKLTQLVRIYNVAQVTRDHNFTVQKRSGKPEQGIDRGHRHRGAAFSTERRDKRVGLTL